MWRTLWNVMAVIGIGCSLCSAILFVMFLISERFNRKDDKK